MKIAQFTTFLLFLGFIFQDLALGRHPELVDGVLDRFGEDRRTLILNGQGIHQVFIFKVYEASLYVEKKSKDPSEILSSSGKKVLLLKFKRDVSANQLRESLYSGFNENCEHDCDRFKLHLDAIAAKVPDFIEGDSLQFSIYPTKLILKSSRGETQEVQAKGFGSKFLAIWLGQSPPSQSLKDKLLGIEDE